MLHIGDRIKEKLKEKKLTMEAFAALIGYTRGGAYTLLEKDTMQMDILVKISRTLDYNFLADIAQENHLLSEAKNILKETDFLKKELNTLQEKWIICNSMMDLQSKYIVNLEYQIKENKTKKK